METLAFLGWIDAISGSTRVNYWNLTLEDNIQDRLGVFSYQTQNELTEMTKEIWKLGHTAIFIDIDFECREDLRTREYWKYAEKKGFSVQDVVVIFLETDSKFEKTRLISISSNKSGGIRSRGYSLNQKLLREFDSLNDQVYVYLLEDLNARKEKSKKWWYLSFIF